MTERGEEYRLTTREEQTLNRCISIEKKCAILYRHFEVLFLDMPEFSALWKNMASEEDSHAETFRLAGRLKGAGVEGVLSGEEDLAFLAKVEKVLDESSTQKPAPAEALQFAIHLEQEVNEFHVGTVLDFSDVLLKRALAENMSFTREHVNALKRALRALAQPEPDDADDIRDGNI